MAMSENRARLGGPIPKFKDYHIWKALYCLSKSAPIGRKKLATLVGVGEGKPFVQGLRQLVVANRHSPSGLRLLVSNACGACSVLF